jgi:hypothetical protein
MPDSCRVLEVPWAQAYLRTATVAAAPRQVLRRCTLHAELKQSTTCRVSQVRPAHCAEHSLAGRAARVRVRVEERRVRCVCRCGDSDVSYIAMKTRQGIDDEDEETTWARSD